MLLFLATCFENTLLGQSTDKIATQQKISEGEAYEKSKSVNALMKGVSLTPLKNATRDDKKLLQQFEKVRNLSAKVFKTASTESRSDLGQQLQFACQEANNIAKLRKTGSITLFPNDCYDQCDDQVGFGAAWNEFFCVFKCFKAAVVHFE